MKHFIQPDWPAPANVRAFTTLRSVGHSKVPFDKFNLAYHVGDNEKDVQANRELLKNLLNLPNEPFWLEQTHSTIVLPITEKSTDKKGDASFTNQAKQVCVIMTADCLPILICNRKGTYVAAIHAGWRGLADGIIEKTLQAMNLSSDDMMAWLGPAIGSKVYEVGAEVRERFIANDIEANQAFVPSKNEGRWLADLYALAKLRLYKQNISAIYGGEYCTYSDKDRFFSYRRDGNQTGRMASLIWMT